MLLRNMHLSRNAGLFDQGTFVAIRKQQWPELKAHVQLVVAAVNAVTPGSYVEVQIR